MNNNWKVVTGEDGTQYYEIEGRVTFPSGDTMSNADGVVMMVAAPNPLYTASPNQDGYTLEDVSAMRNGYGWNDGPGWRQVGTTPYFPVSVAVNRWLPGDPAPGCAEPEQPTGRFRNLDFP